MHKNRKMSKKMSRKISKKRTIKLRKINKHIKKSNSKRSNKFTHGNSHNNKSVNNYHLQNGGFASCNLATVQEPEFNVPALGDIAGLNIGKSRGVIYRPDCKPDTYQAMIP